MLDINAHLREQMYKTTDTPLKIFIYFMHFVIIYKTDNLSRTQRPNYSRM
jgi:hypothetical protein